MRPPNMRFVKLLGLTAPDDRRLKVLAEAAQYLQVSGRLDEAGRLYEALTLLAPRHPLGPLGLAEIALVRGEAALAERWARQAIRALECDCKTMALAYYRLAQACAAREHVDAAAEALGHVLTLDPDGLGAAIAERWSARRSKPRVNSPSAARQLGYERACVAQPGATVDPQLKAIEGGLKR